MKRLFIIATLLSCFNFSFAQGSGPLRTQLNSVFNLIDKSQIPTGILKEYGVPFTSLSNFNGVLTTKNTIDINAWRAIYATLQTARIYGTNTFPDLSVANTTIANLEAANQGLFVVPIFYADYNYLRPDAITSHLMMAISDQLRDVAGRTQSPYVSARAFAASPTVNYATTGTPSFIFKTDAFYKSTTKTMSDLYIDFNDGRGYLSASWNTPIAAAYTDTGTYKLKIKIVFTDNTTAECFSPFRITQIQQPQAFANAVNNYKASQVFPAKAGVHSGGTLYFKLSNTRSNGQVFKPLIVAKGFDMSDVAPKLVSHYGFQNFIGALDEPSSTYNLTGNIDAAGYNIIYLDYNRGTDDIVRNAALLQEVIDWVNSQKAQANSTEQNVVMGISMGGLVARYCLANMTKQNLNHQTRLLLTDDSPHQGANLPLGIQFLTRAIKETVIGSTLALYDLIPEINQAIAALDAPASQQMLILRATNGTGGYVSNAFLNTTYRNMITFPTGGPQPTYKSAAISLGSECGIRSSDPGINLFSESGGFTLGNKYIYSEGMYINSFAKALPAYGTTSTLSQLHIWINVTILNVISINLDLTNKTASSPANTFSWDGVPGGILTTKGQVNTNIPSISFDLKIFSLSSSPSYAPSFTFVPAVSALDITSINSSALTSPYVGGQNPSNPARFAKFYCRRKK
ncbi:MAG: hypothetical protein QM734_14625 [Cyclobacteriaceae bacterium]